MSVYVWTTRQYFLEDGCVLILKVLLCICIFSYSLKIWRNILMVKISISRFDGFVVLNAADYEEAACMRIFCNSEGNPCRNFDICSRFLYSWITNKRFIPVCISLRMYPHKGLNLQTQLTHVTYFRVCCQDNMNILAPKVTSVEGTR
jgi:hypothetical protein